MKTKLLKLTFLAVLLFTFFGCCDDCKECEDERDELKWELSEINSHLKEPFYFNDENLKFDFCSTKEAITPKSEHNTLTGIAKFTIPIPKGSHLTLVSKSAKELNYVCRGKTYSNDVIFENKIVTGMSLEKSAQIQVWVTFVGFEEDRCAGEIKAAQEKKKGSVINGDPLINKENFKISNIDICTEQCAIDRSQLYVYDTKKGTATYTIPYPQGATLKEISNKGNVITYECIDGDYINPNLQSEKFIKSGLSRNSGDSLTIIVIFKDFDCKLSSLAEKKKGSVIQGSPFLLVCGFID